MQELTIAAEALEAYEISKCSDYPTAYATRMGLINLIGGVNPLVNWTPITLVANCGQHTTIVSNSSVGGEVDLYYTSARRPVLSVGDRLAVSQQFIFGVNQTDVFVIDDQGALYVFWVVGGEGWHLPAEIPSAGSAPPGAPLAVSRQFGLDQTDVFWVGNDGAIYLNWVFEDGNWQPQPRGAISTPESAPPPGAPLTVSRQFGLDQTNLFWVGNNGAIYLNWVFEGGDWQPQPLALSPQGFAPPGAPLVVSQQFGINQTDVFVINNEGALTVTWVFEGQLWQGPAHVVFDG